jgi:coenzyme F420 hydrogenase subunit beta
VEKDMLDAIDLETIVSHGLCLGCGLCESIASVDLVEMAVTSHGQMRPRLRQPLEADTMERIRQVCPGITLVGPSSDQVADKGDMHEIWGPIRTIARGWSSDAELRFRSAAGGAMSALGCYLLDSGKVDAVVHVRASQTSPMETDALVSRTSQEVRSGAQSRYGPAAPLRHVMALLDDGLRFAVLAKPCDVAAIRNLGRVDARVERQIPYLITIFCGGVPTTHTAARIAGYHGVPKDQVSLFRWRGNGWPGPTRVETHDGRTFDLSYDKVWYSTDVPWTYDIQFRCKICPDAIGEQADVSCPDSWVMVDGAPIHEEADGANLFIARTKAGEDLVAAALADGAIETEPFTIEELDAQHADHVTRKIENPARVRALGVEGQPMPDFRNYRSERMVALAGPERDAAAEQAARERIRRAAHLEPLA